MQRDDQHTELLDALVKCRASVILSGYPSDLYDERLHGWDRIEIPTTTGQGGSKQDRTEVIWSNRPVATNLCNETLPLTFASNETLDTHSGSEQHPVTADRCPCGRPLAQPTTGRRRKYCSPACRVANHGAKAAPKD